MCAEEHVGYVPKTITQWLQQTSSLLFLRLIRHLQPERLVNKLADKNWRDELLQPCCYWRLHETEALFEVERAACFTFGIAQFATDQ